MSAAVIGAIILALIVLYAVYEWIRVWRLIRVSAGLVRVAKPYQRAEGSNSLLVLGDSTAVGVGAPAKETVAARLSEYLDASVENYAVSGAVSADLAGQLARAKQNQYYAVLIQIGANDVIRFHSFRAATHDLASTLALLAPRSRHIILLTAGKIGDAPFFPLAMRPLLNSQSAVLRRDFMAAASEYGAAYVDLYSAPLRMMGKDPARYYAPDGLHLTGEGYGLWFDYVKATITKRWPTLSR
jgi:lysophospholipase L1-like esterase